MTAVSLACDLAKRFEGCSLTPYLDPVGYWTIGWGHLITHDKAAPEPEMRWTQEEADADLESAMAQFNQGVRSLVVVDLTEAQEAALTDFAYNLGLRSLRASTLLRKANAGDLPGAALEFPKWKFAGGMVLPGLVKRRQAERDLWEAT